MKKLAMIALAIFGAALVLGFASCSNASGGENAAPANNGTPTTQTTEGGGNGGSEGTGGVTTYTVTVAACSNGTVIANPTSAAQDATVTLTINPASGYELDTISVLASANPVALSGTGNARTFTMPAANVTVTVAFKTLPAGFVRVEGATIKGGSKFANNGYTGVFIENRTWMLSDFFMCDHEVTQAEYQAVMNSNHSKFTGNGELPVETKTKNGLGLFDMSGNVYEWCWGGNSNYHIRRGGCWSDGVSECSVAAQMAFDDNRFQDYGIFGLRVVRTCRDYKHAQFAVFLQSFDSDYKIPVIKAVKALTNLGLGEAKALVEGAPRVIIEGLSEAEADKWIADIAEAGGTASKI